jgi:hypothetical protein
MKTSTNFIMKRILFTILLFSSLLGKSQVQVGQSLQGVYHDIFGFSLSMPNSKTLAIGSIASDYQNFVNEGNVTVYSWKGNWEQRGEAIRSGKDNAFTGLDLHMPDENTIVVADYEKLQVYKWDNGWKKKGNYFDCYYDMKSQGKVYMPDSNTIAIGLPRDDQSGEDAGKVTVFDWDGSQWIKRGESFLGSHKNIKLGTFVCMPEKNTLAISTSYFWDDSITTRFGNVGVYNWDGTKWVQKGNLFESKENFYQADVALSMPDKNTLSLSFYQSNKGEIEVGIRTFKWDSIQSNWINYGNDILNELGFIGDFKMLNSELISIGVPYSDTNGEDAGKVVIYRLNKLNNTWEKFGNEILGQNEGDGFGSTIAVTESKIIAISAPHRDKTGNGEGQVRVFCISPECKPTSVIGGKSNAQFQIYPNPTSGILNLQLEKPLQNASYVVYDVLGKEVLRSPLGNSTQVQLKLDVPVGIYCLSIVSDKVVLGKTKVIKQ